MKIMTVILLLAVSMDVWTSCFNHCVDDHPDGTFDFYGTKQSCLDLCRVETAEVTPNEDA